jgi:hypothetical protein
MSGPLPLDQTCKNEIANYRKDGMDSIAIEQSILACRERQIHELLAENTILRESEKHRRELIEENNQLRGELSDALQLVQKYQNELWKDGKENPRIPISCEHFEDVEKCWICTPNPAPIK